MVPLAFGVEAALVERAARAVGVVFAAEVALDLPRDGGLGLAGDCVVEDAAGNFVAVLADLRRRVIRI